MGTLRKIVWIAVGVIVVPFVLIGSLAGSRHNAPTAVVGPPVAADVAAVVPAQVKAPRIAETKWKYKSLNDPMEDKPTRMAYITSNQQLSFAFPYSGTNQPQLTVRKDHNGRLDVLLQIDKGQFICGYEDCFVMVKFEGAKQQKFKALKPSDHSSMTLFIEPASKFVKMLKSSKDTRIEATFYNEGNHVMSFSTAGFNFDK